MKFKIPLLVIKTIETLNKAGFEGKGKSQLLEYLSKRFDRIIITSSDLFEFEKILTEDISEYSLDFKHCVIQEFGSYATSSLAERWITLGQEKEIERVELSRQLKNLRLYKI